jgi:dihydrofolate reductase
MGKVTTGFSMSLDGFVAGPNDNPDNALGDGGDRLFKWYFTGLLDDTVPIGEGEMKMSHEGAEMVKQVGQVAGVLVTARRTFDIAHDWGGRHPMGVPMVVLTHRVPQEWMKVGSPFTFVTGGVENAIERAQQIAGDKDVVVGAPSVVKQCLNAGLLEEIHIDLVPVLLGHGIRLFDLLEIGPLDLRIDEVKPGNDVIHITFSVLRDKKA